MSEPEPRVLSLVAFCLLECHGENLGWELRRGNAQTFAHNPSVAEPSMRLRGGM